MTVDGQRARGLPVALVLAATAMVSACKKDLPEQKAAEPKPGVDLAFEVPQDAAPQLVNVVTRDIPSGAEIPWHTHPGVEIAYVESGQVELAVAGEAKRRLEPGGHFMVPRATVHSGRNVGEGWARLVLTYVVDRGKPLRSPAEPPAKVQD